MSDWEKEIREEIIEIIYGDISDGIKVNKLQDLIRQQFNDYSVWLEQCGYLDSDWWSEEPNAIDRYTDRNIKE